MDAGFFAVKYSMQVILPANTKQNVVMHSLRQPTLPLRPVPDFARTSKPCHLPPITMQADRTRFPAEFTASHSKSSLTI
jgi:hypothetical protein